MSHNNLQLSHMLKNTSNNNNNNNNSHNHINNNQRINLHKKPFLSLIMSNPQNASLSHSQSISLPKILIKNIQQQLSLKCILCTNLISQPMKCPKCNQIFCKQCIQNYVTEIIQACPICHQNISFNQFQLYQCHGLLMYLKEQMKKLALLKKQTNYQMYQVDSNSQKYMQISGQYYIKNNIKNNSFKQQQKCIQHNLQMRYYCQNCSKPICSDCGMISSLHRGHKFIHLNDIYKKIKQKLNIQLNRLNNKILSSQQYSLKIKKQLHKLQIQHLHIKRYTQEYYLLLVGKFQDEITTKTICLKQIQQKNSKQIQFYQSCRDSICEEIQKKSKHQLIKQADKLSMSFAMVVCQPPQPIKIQDNFQTIKQLTPEYNHFKYTLNNFSLSTSRIVYSDPYILNGAQWRLKIYPKGNGVAQNKYLSVFVQMTKAETNQKKYQYKIQLINKDQNVQSVKREYCSSFDIGQCWGYNQFILLEQLQSTGYLVQDKLNFVMGIRNPDYKSLANDHNNYIKILEEQIKLKQLEKQNNIQQTNIIDQLESINTHGQNKIYQLLQVSSSKYQQRNNQNKLKQKQIKKQYEKSQKYDKQQQKLTIQLFNQLCEKSQTSQNSFKQHYKSNKNISNSNDFCLNQQISEKFLMTNDLKTKPNEKFIKKELKIIRKPKQNQKKQQSIKSIKSISYQEYIRQHQNIQKCSQQIYFEPKLKFSQKDKIAEFTLKNKNKNIKKSKQKQKFFQFQQHKYQNEEKNEDRIEIQKKQSQFLSFNQDISEIRQKKQDNLNSALKQKKHLISKKELSRKITSSNNVKIQEEQKRQKKISNILQQSKKLEGITYQNDFMSNSSGYKQAGTLSLVRNSAKNLFISQRIKSKSKSRQKQQEKYQKINIKKSLSNQQDHRFKQ